MANGLPAFVDDRIPGTLKRKLVASLIDLDPHSDRWMREDGTVDVLKLARACWQSGWDHAAIAGSRLNGGI